MKAGCAAQCKNRVSIALVSTFFPLSMHNAINFLAHMAWVRHRREECTSVTARLRLPANKCRLGRFLLLVAALSPGVQSARPQQISRVDRDLAETMLNNVSEDVRKYYFDPKLRGLDWDALVRQTRGDIEKAPNADVALAEIESLLERLNDSHTNFIPEIRPSPVDYGWTFKLIGNRALVTEVNPKSDAERQGMKPGDEVLKVNGYTVTRTNVNTLKSAIYEYFRRSSLDVELRDSSGKVRDLNVAARVKKQTVLAGLGDDSWGINQRIIDSENAVEPLKYKYRELGPDLMVLRIPAFIQTGPSVDEVFQKARGHKALIVDLRGTPGGIMTSVTDYLSHIFNREVNIGDWIERNKTTPIRVKGRGKDAYFGDVIVLVDSETASGGEIFARAVQLEERGTIVGDRTSGRTMGARMILHVISDNALHVYGDAVTVADAVMSDGKSLERVGVEPDPVCLPTQADLAAGRDPVLAYAARLAGVTLSPEDAAKLFSSDSAGN